MTFQRLFPGFPLPHFGHGMPAGKPPPILSLVSTGKVYYNDFSETDDLTKLGVGTWTLNTAQERLEFTSATAGHYIAYRDVSPLVDYVMETRTMGDGAAFSAGCVGRVTDINNFYRAIEHSLDALYVQRMAGGTLVDLGSVAHAYDPNVWYVVRFWISGSTLKAIVDLVDEVTVSDTTFTDQTLVGLGGYHPAGGETYFFDYLKIFKSPNVTVTNLLAGQRVELYDSADVLKASATVPAGATSLTLDLWTVEIPVDGYFKVYKEDGVTFWYRSPRTGTVEVWGGDEWRQE